LQTDGTCILFGLVAALSFVWGIVLYFNPRDKWMGTPPIGTLNPLHQSFGESFESFGDIFCVLPQAK
jgi:hypothetical protein